MRSIVARNVLIAVMRLVPAILLGLSVLLAGDAARAQTWGRKLARGFGGMTLGVLEVPGNMVMESDARGAAEGLPFGFAKGLGMLVSAAAEDDVT